MRVTVPVAECQSDGGVEDVRYCCPFGAVGFDVVGKGGQGLARPVEGYALVRSGEEGRGGAVGRADV